jgi:glycogen operon protein
MLIDVPPSDDGARDVVFIAFNGSHEPVATTLPGSPLEGGWRRLLDTDHDIDAEEAHFAAGDIYDLKGRSVVLFEAVS